jgi:uncharacterized membrane protein YsdA (DUF1294 family)/cold shock CspA family protein
MRYQGKITRWNDNRGFGFIIPDGGGENIFVHISGFISGQRRPIDGEMVTYEVAINERKRVFATKVTFLGTSVSNPGVSSGTMQATAVASLFLAFVGLSVYFGYLPVAVPVIYLVFSCFAFALYGFDKYAAKNDRWRTRESSLHLLEILGGWPGAIVAQRLFRHKSIKPSFQFMFWAMVILNCAALGWLFTETGSATFRTLLREVRIFNPLF